MSKLARLAGISQRTLVANGSNDIMVPTVNSYLLAGHIPHAELVIYPGRWPRLPVPVPARVRG